MTSLTLQGAPVLVVGAGIMGAGIAQVAAAAGHRVMLFDTRDGAAASARERLAATLDGLVAKGKLAAGQAQATLARIESIAVLQQAGGARLVVEAIVEDLAAKRTLLRQLETVVDADAVLATNTSSISVTALAAGLAQPRRLVGMHFFNRIARPYYAEALALLHEQVATPQMLDACLRAAGFRMGPCELMDLIGHDTNFAVTNSVYEANFYDKRYMPSLVQRELVDGGLLGRKTGRGFYRYPEGVPALPVALHEAPATARALTVHGGDAVADFLEQAATAALAPQGWGPRRESGSGWTGLAVDGLHLVLTDGRPAYAWAAAHGQADVAVFDRPLMLPAAPGTALAYAVADSASESGRTQAPAWLAALGFTPLAVADTPGLVVARTVAMLINEAADAVRQGVCTPEGADAAMKLGVNYPAGPFEWLARWNVPGVAGVIDALDALYRGERYRLSPGLRQRARALP